MLKLLLLLSTCLLLLGCAASGPTTRPASASQRQQAALSDPFGYKSDIDTDITGGDVSHFDRGAMNKDVDHVLNP